MARDSQHPRGTPSTSASPACRRGSCCASCARCTSAASATTPSRSSCTPTWGPSASGAGTDTPLRRWLELRRRPPPDSDVAHRRLRPRRSPFACTWSPAGTRPPATACSTTCCRSRSSTDHRFAFGYGRPLQYSRLPGYPLLLAAVVHQAPAPAASRTCGSRRRPTRSSTSARRCSCSCSCAIVASASARRPRRSSPSSCARCSSSCRATGSRSRWRRF